MASKVFYTDLRTDPDHHLLYKLEKLVRKAGMAILILTANSPQSRYTLAR